MESKSKGYYQQTGKRMNSKQSVFEMDTSGPGNFNKEKASMSNKCILCDFASVGTYSLGRH